VNEIRIVVVDDHALFRAGLISLLNELDDLQVVGEAGDGASALRVIQKVKPDVVLLDVNMPGMGGVETVKALRKENAPKIIMLTISKNEEDLLGAITAGADGYLLKSAEPEELHKAILLVHQGMSVLSPQITRQVLRAVSVEQLGSTDNAISSREMEVLTCLAQGMTTIQIAGELYISENTVKTHVRHILEKLEASNRAEAVSKAAQLGLIGQDRKQ
jgi:DNA-binding NarL/FixJ family response regulator